ncbi:O-antigen ligase family protein [Nibricoccus sp. IMCC34717]|uniref:O-antigen ligase family protein n=1 Tax=Nibricoccus sp. IMCC34717 TaxID=3034021 RepID=UPI00384A758D
MILLRDRILIGVAAFVAVATGFGVATGDWFWPALAALVGAALLFVRVSPLPLLPAVLLGLVFGYFVGNRGFAQLSASDRLPLFPAELGLGLGLAAWLWQRARAGGLDWHFRGMPMVVFIWLLYGTARLYPEARTYGIVAFRDYAMVYYGAFFFLAWSASRQVDLPALLLRTFRLGSLLLVPLYWLFSLYPDQMAAAWVVRGNPVFFYKADIAATFLSIGCLCWFLRGIDARQRWLAWLASLACAATVFSTHNRASMLGLAVGVALLAVRGRTRLLKAALATGLAGTVALAVWVETGQRSWEDTPVPALVEALVSTVDLQGQGRYRAEEVENKGDNNRFRAVWWRTVVRQTWAESPVVGLGYGYDLAAPFLRVYYPDSNEDFTARSPHSIWVTVFARLGFVGLGLFTAVAAALGIRTWRALASPDYRVNALPGLCALMILASAGFGVVLEGPMGAVLFWVCAGAQSVRE